MVLRLGHWLHLGYMVDYPLMVVRYDLYPDRTVVRESLAGRRGGYWTLDAEGLWYTLDGLGIMLIPGNHHTSPRLDRQRFERWAWHWMRGRPNWNHHVGNPGDRYERRLKRI